jgi:predicted phosphoribosyltransferase
MLYGGVVWRSIPNYWRLVVCIVACAAFFTPQKIIIRNSGNASWAFIRANFPIVRTLLRKTSAARVVSLNSLFFTAKRALSETAQRAKDIAGVMSAMIFLVFMWQSFRSPWGKRSLCVPSRIGERWVPKSLWRTRRRVTYALNAVRNFSGAQNDAINARWKWTWIEKGPAQNGMSTRIFEKKELRGKNYVFKDRVEAGRMLAEMLATGYEAAQDSIVLAIPSGGVPVGLQVRRRLNFPFDLMIVRKIPVPHNPEAGYGAVTLEGGVFLNEELVSRLRLSPSQIENHITQLRKELEERDALFRGKKPLSDLLGKTAILVDDGLASGYTMMASVHSARNRGAKEIVVAVPTAPPETIEKIGPMVDEIYCPNVRDKIFFAVADAYENWYDLDREEVLAWLAENRS